jgi:hypothetical protein
MLRSCAVLPAVGGSAAVFAQVDEPASIGSRLELFVDDYLIDHLTGDAALRLHQPAPQEVAIVHDAPWEGNGSMYTTVFQDGPLYRMYYRGVHSIMREGGWDDPHPMVTCYAESRDGITWTKPELGLFEFNGSKANNIVWPGPHAGNFVPFKDGNPDCPPQERYKAVAGGPLIAACSPDGIHWKQMREEPIITQGAFDSQNLVFWDAVRGEYREYHRDFRNGRDIRTAASKDFLNWPTPEWLEYDPGRGGELYTNQILPYYRAPHIFLGFPTRYVDRGWSPSMEALPQLDHRRLRASAGQREGTALTEGLFMSSRNGLRFHVWPEAFIRPGLRLRENWFYGDNYQAWGIVQTASQIEGAPNELSVYATESVSQGDSCRHRRYTLRIDGFVSVQAPMSGGELVTRPLVFAGKELVLNCSTSAAGAIRIEIQEPWGTPIEGFALADCPEIFGDDLERVVPWKNGTDISALAGRPIRLRFELKDADLYSIQFRP